MISVVKLSSVTKKAVPSLDGLRAVSIMLVIMGHASDTFSWGEGTGASLRVILGNSRLGVLTFFVISGYLITYLLRREVEAQGHIHLRSFYARRILRIFPAFYAYLLVVTFLALGGVVTTRAMELFSAGTFTLNYWLTWHNDVGAPSGYWFVGHFWTLALEEQFYLLWPLTLIVIGLRRSKWVALGLIALTPVIRVATYIFWPEARGAIGTMLHTASDTLMIGCALALLQGEPKFETWARRIANAKVATPAAFFVLIVSPFLAERFTGAYVLSIGTTLESLALAAIIVYVTRKPDSMAGRILNSPPFVFVGVLSYSLYLWQQLFLTPLNRTWSGIFPLNIVVCFAVALLSHTGIERPFLRLKQLCVRSPARSKSVMSDV